MAMLSCPKCSSATPTSGYPFWVIVVAICFFPVGLLALLVGRKPSTCPNCGYTWQP